MNLSPREKVAEANAPYRDQIIATKRKLRSQIPDLNQRFDQLTSNIEAQLETIERERAQGIEPVPQLDFSQLSSVSAADISRIKQRGCLVIRNVFDDERVRTWNDQLASYFETNNYLEKRNKSAAEDNYFNTLASDKPQIYGVFWSRPQMEARTDPNMAQAKRFLNRLWKFDTPKGQEFNPDSDLVYADRVRFRQPGDASLGLSAHVDSGSIERWIDPAYQLVYREVFGGDIRAYDPFDAYQRTSTIEIPSPAVCRMFRSFQAWTALTSQGPGDGTLQLLPVANAMAWMLLRALLDDVPEDELCGAAACRAMMISDQYHSLLKRGYGSIPLMQPGDTVWWHPDVLHGVEDVHRGTGYSNVMYIAPAPDCQKNRRYSDQQRPAFEQGLSAPDFAQDNFEVDFRDRFLPSDLSPLGRQQMGYPS